MKKSLIKWTQHTWNPTTGCTIFSKECENCYAKTFTENLQKKLDPKYIHGFDNFVEHAHTLKQPFVKWKKPSVIFVNSMSDLFHKDCSLGFLKKVFDVMNNTPHTYQILTKRDAILVNLSNQLNWTNNIWMGVSVGSVVSVRKIDSLRKCGAKNKFLSIEPLIEELPDLDLAGIDWVIVGGESGSGNIRPMKKEWVLKIKKNCEDQNVPFFFKQWGDLRNNPDPKDPTINKSHPQYEKGGCMLDGKLYLDNPCIVKPIIGELPF